MGAVVVRERWEALKREPGFWILAAAAVILLLSAIVTAALQVH